MLYTNTWRIKNEENCLTISNNFSSIYFYCLSITFCRQFSNTKIVSSMWRHQIGIRLRCSNLYGWALLIKLKIVINVRCSNMLRVPSNPGIFPLFRTSGLESFTSYSTRICIAYIWMSYKKEQQKDVFIHQFVF